MRISCCPPRPVGRAAFEAIPVRHEPAELGYSEMPVPLASVCRPVYKERETNSRASR